MFQDLLLPNLLYAELLSIFDCLATFLSLQARSDFKELFPMRTFFTVSQSRDTVAQLGDTLNTDDVNTYYLAASCCRKVLFDLIPYVPVNNFSVMSGFNRN